MELETYHLSYVESSAKSSTETFLEGFNEA